MCISHGIQHPEKGNDGINSMLRACGVMRLRVKGKMDLKGLERALHSVPLRLQLDKGEHLKKTDSLGEEVAVKRKKSEEVKESRTKEGKKINKNEEMKWLGR